MYNYYYRQFRVCRPPQRDMFEYIVLYGGALEEGCVGLYSILLLTLLTMWLNLLPSIEILVQVCKGVILTNTYIKKRFYFCYVIN